MHFARFRVRTMMIAVVVVAVILGTAVWVDRVLNDRKRAWIISEHERMAQHFRLAADQKKATLEEYRSYERRVQELLQAGEFTPAQAERRAAHWRNAVELLEPSWRREDGEGRWYSEQAEALRHQAKSGMMFDLNRHRQVVRKHIQEDEATITQQVASGR